MVTTTDGVSNHLAVLDTITGPDDVRRLRPDELRRLTDDLRARLVEVVCNQGGHLGPNLGVVELTVAVHRVFDSPRTPLVFDTGHQSYVHKLLTGRQDTFPKLRQADGPAGYPRRCESPHDMVEDSHASTGLAYADGLSRAFALSGHADRPVVVVVGDGALTGGLAWEALNNLGGSGRRVVVVLNDNGRSYSPTVGALARHLHRIRDRGRYHELQRALGGTTTPAPTSAPAGIFEALGFEYLGPVDGHDLAALEQSLQQAKEAAGPVVVHCLTDKGRGHRPAEQDEADHFHTVGVVDPATGAPQQAAGPQWTHAFADALVGLARERPELVGISAAMLGPTGLQRLADEFPDRCYDVGIAEQHALTMAAGLAMGGMHPVVGLYATFANRAYDQLLMDVGLHALPVTLVLDRAGITGPDGPSHHGMWDLALLGTVPGLRVAAPRDAVTLQEELAEAVATDTGPTALRFPKAQLGPPVPAVARVGGMDLLRTSPAREVLLVGAGVMAAVAAEAAGTLAHLGVDCTVVDPRWVLPPPAELVDLAAGHRLVVTLEDGIRDGGVGARVALALGDRGIDVPVRCLGLATEFVAHGKRADLLADAGLDAHGVAVSVKEALGEVRGRNGHRPDHGAAHSAPAGATSP